MLNYEKTEPLKHEMCVVCEKKEPRFDIHGNCILVKTALGFMHVSCEKDLKKLLKRLKFKEYQFNGIGRIF